MSTTAFLGSALPISITGGQAQAGVLSQTPTYYAINITDSGRLTAEVDPSGGAARLSLLAADGSVLMQSDGQSPSNPNDLLDLHVTGSTVGTIYYLEVQGLGGAAGSYALQTSFTTATPPFQPIPAGSSSQGRTFDLLGNGIADVVLANFNTGDLSVLLGRGDGTFAPEVHYAADQGVSAVIAADLKGDGVLDLISANLVGTISILKGNGDGTFAAPTQVNVGVNPSALVAGDFNGDGHVDLAVADLSAGTVAVLIGRGDGTFDAPSYYQVGYGSTAILAADLNQDGRLDLATADKTSNSVSVLLGNGDGTFQPVRTFAVGESPSSLVVADFRGDGRLDIATANNGSNDVSVLLGTGDGTFAAATSLTAGAGTTGLIAADLSHDGHADLAAANLLDGTLSIFAGHGDGTFSPQTKIDVGSTPVFLVAADFNRDGNMDLAHGDNNNHVFIDLGRGDGTFQTLPPTASAANPKAIATTDFNGDGSLDMAVVNNNTNDVQILLGRKDGTFQIGARYALGTQPFSIATGDFNHDGSADLVVTNLFNNNIAVLLGHGDGTFGAATFFTAGVTPVDVVTGDFNGDGNLDVAVADASTNTVSILLGSGDGKFSDPQTYSVGYEPLSLVIGDFNGDGNLDLATANYYSNDVSVLLGRGDGTFGTEARLSAGMMPYTVVVGDFNGDGRVDLAATNYVSGTVSVFLGQGNGSFTAQATFAAGPSPAGLVVADFNGDGHADLAVTNSSLDGTISSLTLLFGQGDGTFQDDGQLTVGSSPTGIVAGDFNGDGRLDLATANTLSNDVSVLLSRGDGTFQSAINVAVAGGPVAIISADFNNDGYLDLVTANPTTGNIEVSLSNGDGTFKDPLSIGVGGGPSAITTGDFNHDGREDVAVADSQTDTVSILLGIGDGTFEPPLTLAVGSRPDALATGDFNGDGFLDLAVANNGSDTVSIYFGRSDGTFTAAQQIAVGAGPIALAVGDVNNDSTTELIVANSLSRSLSILEGARDGTFRVVATVALGTVSSSVVTGDFNGDGKLDIAVADQADNAVSVLLGHGDGTFQAPVQFATGLAPVALVTGDFNGDGYLDLATANNNSNDVTVLLGRGDGNFQAQAPYAVSAYPSGLVVGDFNNDGRLDLVTANGLGVAVSVGLGFGDGTFTEPGTSFVPVQARPIVADVNGDGILDVVVLRGDGKILFRAGLAGGGFSAPLVINPDLAWAARDLTIGSSPGLSYLVATNARAGSLAYYAYLGGQFRQLYAPTVPGALPAHFLYGDINGDGLQDGIMYLGDTGQIIVYLQHPNDDFSDRPADYQIQVGRGVSSMTVADVNGDGRLDILVTDESSGEVHVFLNSATAPFSSELSFRAGDGLVSLAPVNGTPQLESHDRPVAMVVGLFSGGTIPDLAVLNQGANRVDILVGDGQGGVFNPTPALSLLTGPDPVAILTADVNGDGIPDLVVLNKGSSDVSVFLGDGHGGFTEELGTGPDGQKVRPSAGNSPTGLTVVDINGDGKLDLLVGNAQGDILILLGNGDGTFRPYQRIDRHIGLAVTDLNSTGAPGIAFANQALDQVTYQSDLSTTTFQQGRQNGVLAPSAVQFADLNGDGISDLILVNSGSNDVLVYLGLGNDQFGPAHRFFVGTDPAGVTVADVNGDGIPDLVVANEGSNDVSIWFGQGQGADWTMTPGPRLNAGMGPVATVVQDVTGDGIPDILVANSGSNDVYLLPGVGRGFFNDQTPVIYQTGSDPVQLFVGNFDTAPGLDLVTVNAGSEDLTFFSSFGPGRSVSTGSTGVVTAVAGDFDHDGTSALIVAGANGYFALLEGNANGLQVTNALIVPGIVNLSDMALGRMIEGTVDLYVTTEGASEASLITFVLDLSPILPPGVTAVEATGADAGNRLVAEFSSPSDSRLEIVATLTLATDDAVSAPPTPTTVANGVIPAVWVVGDGLSTEDFDALLVAAGTDDETRSLDRNALITGALETIVPANLTGPEDDELPPLEVPFPSPLEWFDFREKVAFNPQWRRVIEEVSRWTVAADGSAPAPAQVAESEAPIRSEASDDSPNPGDAQVENQGEQPLVADTDAEPLRGELVREPARRSLSPGHLATVAVGLFSPWLFLERPERSRREDTKRFGGV